MKLKALTTIRRICGLLGVVVCDGIMFIMSININTIYSFSFLTLWMKGTSIFQEFPPALLRCSTSKWHNDNSKRQSEKKTSSFAYTIDHNDTKMNVNNATESKSPSFFSSCNSMLALDTEKHTWKAKLSKQCSRNEFSTAHELIRSNSFTEWKTSSYGWLDGKLFADCVWHPDLTVYPVPKKAHKPFRLFGLGTAAAPTAAALVTYKTLRHCWHKHQYHIVHWTERLHKCFCLSWPKFKFGNGNIIYLSAVRCVHRRRNNNYNRKSIKNQLSRKIEKWHETYVTFLFKVENF